MKSIKINDEVYLNRHNLFKVDLSCLICEHELPIFNTYNYAHQSNNLKFSRFWTYKRNIQILFLSFSPSI